MSEYPPRITRHLEALTDDCSCAKLPCGGVDTVREGCVEHGGHAELFTFHTHAVQVDRINRGLRIA